MGHRPIEFAPGERGEDIVRAGGPVGTERLPHERGAVRGEGSFGARAQCTLRLAERQADAIQARAVEEATIALTEVRVAAHAALDELGRVLLARVEAEG